MEILVSIVIMAIGLSTVIVVFMGGRFILKQAENKSRAISVAAQKVEEHLTKSFAGLGGLSTLDFNSSGVDVGSGQQLPIDWRVDISTEWESNRSLGIKIPYKVIQVNASYNEEVSAGNMQRKVVMLRNIVPYPYMHTQVVKIEPSSSAPEVREGRYQAINGLSLDFDFPVNKDVMVIYNIAIRVEDDSGIEPIDTIYTACFLGNNSKPQGTETRTPIGIQPFISNILAIDNVKPNERHTLEIRWRKDTSQGRITLKEANLIIIATERQ